MNIDYSSDSESEENYKIINYDNINNINNTINDEIINSVDYSSEDDIIVNIIDNIDILDSDISNNIDLTTTIKNDNNKIDIVITFVDNTNNQWQELFHSYDHIMDPCNNSKTENRFRNNNELKYCLRGIDKYIDFYNHIYLVMNHDPPEWLNINNKNITIIKHEEIDGLNKCLPTFNSQAIECNLHKIKKLTQNFIYFNDDVFINKKLSKSYFIENNKVKIYVGALNNHLNKIPDSNNTGYNNSWINTNNLLDKNYIKEPRFVVEHYPQIINISDMHYLNIKFSNEFKTTTESKFRDINNITPTCTLLQYYYYYKYKGILIRNPNIKTVFITDCIKTNLEKLETLNEPTIEIFCLEDKIFQSTPDIQKILNKFFESKYPDKSQFEL